MNKLLARTLALTVAALLIFPVAANAQADDVIDSLITDEIYMMKGDLVTLSVDALTRLSLTDPEAVDIVDADEEEVLLIAQEPGQSTLFIWDSHGKRTITIFVSGDDLVQIKKRVKALLKSANIHSVQAKINKEEGKIVLVGEVKKDDDEKFGTVVDDFDDNIIDLTTEEEVRDLIEINMQISEVSTTVIKNLGFDWGAGGQSDLIVGYQERRPDSDGSFGSLFQIGDFERVNGFNVIINALEDQNKAKILARPRVVTVSGEEASFLVGGEIPIRTTTASEGTTQENVEFKDYGISMTLKPTVINEKVEIVLTVEDSDIDTANSLGGETAFLTRTAQTTLLLNNKQQIVLAGFIRKARSEQITKVPFLSNVPVVGALFRNRNRPSDTDTELIISLTPTILEKNRKGNALLVAEKTSQDLKKAPAKRVNPNYVSGIPQEMTNYIQSIQQQISQEILYPPEAKTHGWEGTVKLGMLILNDGTLAYALVKNSSGYEVFDEFALNKARESAPFDPFPAGASLQELSVTIPIVYSLDN